MAIGANVQHGIRLYRPAPELQAFVRHYAHRTGRIVGAHAVHVVQARAAPVLEFGFGDAILFAQSDGKPPIVSPRAVLVGIQTHRRGELRIAGAVDSFAILFQPSAFELLFALPAQDFTDQAIDAESVLGPMLSRLYERLADCRSFEERVKVANGFLSKRAAKTRGRNEIMVVVDMILNRAGGVPLPEMASRAGLGLRQLERKFRQQIGVSPKLFARIARFEAALDGMARSPGNSWTEVAHRFGYYDQMHMIHEFSQFTGETPARALRNFQAAFGPNLEEERARRHLGTRERWIL